MRTLLIFLGLCLIIVNAKLKQASKREETKVSHEECAIDAVERMDCGYYGITETQCSTRDCCWTESNLPGVPWCFHTVRQSREVCIMHEAEREDCGYYGIQLEECAARGCCWQPSESSNTPWCFFSSDPMVPEGSCGSPALNPSVISRIVGGEDALPHSWPWQVSFRGEMGHFCGGALVAPRWVVTAAHCNGPSFMSSFTSPDTKLAFGVQNLNMTTDSIVEASIEAAFMPEFDYFEGGDIDNDIALIKLDRDIEYTPEISPVCLPRAGEELPVGKECYTSGWGTTEFMGPVPDILQQALIPVLDRDYCNRTLEEPYQGMVSENMVCAGFEDGRTSSCHGDSGGPFVCSDQGHWVLYGAVSWGVNCEGFVLYSRVANYMDWIETMMAENA